MIKNEVQYRVTKAEVERFQKALKNLSERTPRRLAKDDTLRHVYAASIKSQLEDLEAELAEYEALRGGAGERLELRSLDDLPRILVQARIAAGLSQRELADRLAMKEQQIQRYEATDYASASLTRLKAIALATGLRLKEAAVFEPTVRRTLHPHQTTGTRRATAGRRSAAKKTGSKGTKTAAKAAAKKATVRKRGQGKKRRS